MRFTRIGLLAAFVAAIAGCGYPYLFEDQGSLSPPQTGVNSLDVETGNGFVRVTRVADSSGIAIAYTRRANGTSREDAQEHINDVTVSSRVEDGVLKVKAEWPEGPRGYGCDFNVQMGVRIPVSITTSNGLIALAGTDAPATLETTNGPIEVSNTSGQTTARSTNGAIRFAGHRGPLDVRTTNGPVTCDIDVLIPTDAVVLQTSNAAVTLNIPAATQADFDALTSNAEATVDGFPDVNFTRSDRDHKTGTINGGGADLALSTSNGRVEINGR
jgi:hypothetical protein